MARTEAPADLAALSADAMPNAEALSDREGLSSAASQDTVCDSPTPSDLRSERNVERPGTPSPRSGSDDASHASAPSPVPEPDLERWWLELGANFARADGQLPDDYAVAQRGTLEAKVASEITQDLHRTFPTPAFAAIRGPERLGNVLRAYAVRNTAVGYSQSMNFIAGFLLIYSSRTWPEMTEAQQEERVFWMLCAIIELPKYNRGYYNRKGSTSALHTEVQVLAALTKLFLPAVHERLAAYELLYTQLVLKWFATVFLYDMEQAPSPLVRQVWESYVLEGSTVLHRTTISLLAACEADILAKQEEEMMLAVFDRVRLLRNDALTADQIVHNPERKSEVTAALVAQLRAALSPAAAEERVCCGDDLFCSTRPAEWGADKGSRVCSVAECVIA